ncbi:hypothetical protein [Candidatus Methylobacter favarea]|uniref:hypothetical protein n=1 Tax=Candidatus Methylobacter favarea TaxID=2707345 RepID=UPI00157C4831|nr:hypothetical protein [Candidatus Methylobacter favarea]
MELSDLIAIVSALTADYLLCTRDGLRIPQGTRMRCPFIARDSQCTGELLILAQS